MDKSDIINRRYFKGVWNLRETEYDDKDWNERQYKNPLHFYRRRSQMTKTPRRRKMVHTSLSGPS